VNVFQPDDDGGAADVGGLPGVVVPCVDPEVVPGVVSDGVGDCTSDDDGPGVSGGVVADGADPEDVAGVVAAPLDPDGPGVEPQPAKSRAASVSAARGRARNAAEDAATRCLIRLATSRAAYCPAGRSEVIILLMSLYSAVSR
jgi:hypothetical protein